ncbi:hypothetical protein COV93_04295 [Candidatus Woesearchaeota archaeon CG11_big_fil_rev_8_21_14_0_20_43_8]|nr:MAG: hypothetical protein COV93_04295 [Candidatus Woesearchaeota archaeon CG11_big_fil_rev_8_21_14_0_20_43_8]PIO07010.1 MAG: hypothetical protein COT47_01895 [Candidatus Woesearchaeota archaeon CG08_land_8_20_14_0_20_43_7]
MIIVLDKKDKEILKALMENSRYSIQEISEKTQIPITTIHNRIKRLESSGVIKQYTAIVDESAFGDMITAHLLVQASGMLPNMTKVSIGDIATRVKSLEGVLEVTSVVGVADLVVKVCCKSIQILNDNIIRAIKNVGGVERVQLLIVLKNH